jgi:hypothetical protein
VQGARINYLASTHERKESDRKKVQEQKRRSRDEGGTRRVLLFSEPTVSMNRYEWKLKQYNSIEVPPIFGTRHLASCLYDWSHIVILPFSDQSKFRNVFEQLV